MSLSTPLFIFQFFIISHDHNIKSAMAIKEFLIKEKNISSKEIEINESKTPCSKQATPQKVIGHFCLENGDLKILKLDLKIYEQIYTVL